MLKPQVKIRDIIAVPFISIGHLFMYVGVMIGTSWTSWAIYQLWGNNK